MAHSRALSIANPARHHGPPVCTTCPIREQDLFAALVDDAVGPLAQVVEQSAMEAGALLHHAGQAGTWISTLQRGAIKLSQVLPDGTQRIVRLLRPGDVLGLELLVEGRFQHTAQSIVPSTVCRIAVATLRAAADSDPAKFQALMQRWQQNLEEADYVITYLSTGSARSRIARLMLHLEDPHAPGHCMALSRDDMGALLGITSETASRVMAEFKRLEWVTEGNGSLQLNLPALRAVAND